MKGFQSFVIPSVARDLGGWGRQDRSSCPLHTQVPRYARDDRFSSFILHPSSFNHDQLVVLRIHIPDPPVAVPAGHPGDGATVAADLVLVAQKAFGARRAALVVDDDLAAVLADEAVDP